MKALLVYFRGYIKDSILGPVFKLIEASFELLVPLVIAGIVDTTIPNKDQNHLFMMIFLLFGLAVIRCVCKERYLYGLSLLFQHSIFHPEQPLAMPEV